LKQGNHYQVIASGVKLIWPLADFPQEAKDILELVEAWRNKFRLQLTRLCRPSLPYGPEVGHNFRNYWSAASRSSTISWAKTWGSENYRML
jgi:hypothetical protein